MSKNFKRLIGIICVDALSIPTLIAMIPGYVKTFISTIKSSFGSIDKINLVNPWIALLQLLFLVVYAILIIYFNIHEFKKMK